VANTLIKSITVTGGHIHIYETTSAATTETLQLPPGKAIAIPLYVSYVGGTPTTPTFSYVRATGVLSVITLTATNNIMFAVLTD
jgi:hypothetical protein